MLFVTVLLFSDPLLYVHLRIGLLDPPLTAFLLLSAILACRFSLAPAPKLASLIPLGLVLGLALSVKLLTLLIIPLVLGLVLYRLRRERARKRDYCLAALLLLGLPPVMVIGGYLLQGYSFRETYDLLVFNFSWHSTAKSWDQITSRWYEWLYIGNPLWYFNRTVDGDHSRVMLATGNLILWVGAEVLALYALFRKWRRPEVLFLAALILVQLGIYARKPHTYIHYMTEILPFLYVLMGVGIADVFDRCENRYRRVLQFDFALFGLISFLTFWNYWPYISGKPVTREQMRKAGHWNIQESKSTPQRQ
jgi:dolichyl-phosphate-mannose--protein O-mannosyl transferase